MWCEAKPRKHPLFARAPSKKYILQPFETWLFQRQNKVGNNTMYKLQRSGVSHASGSLFALGFPCFGVPDLGSNRQTINRQPCLRFGEGAQRCMLAFFVDSFARLNQAIALLDELESQRQHRIKWKKGSQQEAPSFYTHFTIHFPTAYRHWHGGSDFFRQLGTRSSFPKKKQRKGNSWVVQP